MSDSEIAILLEALAKQVQMCLDGQARLREFVIQQIQVNLDKYATKDRINGMEHDISDLEKRIEEMERRILENQEKNYRKTITGQWAILSAIIIAVVTFFVNFVLTNLIHIH